MVYMQAESVACWTKRDKGAGEDPDEDVTFDTILAAALDPQSISTATADHRRPPPCLYSHVT